MAIETDHNYVRQERDYSAEQSDLNRAHQIRLKEMEIELEKYKFESLKYLNPLKEILKLPVRLLLLIPLLVAVIRKHKVDKILDIIK